MIDQLGMWLAQPTPLPLSFSTVPSFGRKGPGVPISGVFLLSLSAHTTGGRLTAGKAIIFVLPSRFFAQHLCNKTIGSCPNLRSRGRCTPPWHGAPAPRRTSCSSCVVSSQSKRLVRQAPHAEAGSAGLLSACSKAMIQISDL